MDMLGQAKEFEEDFVEAIQTLHVLAAKHSLPPPEIVLGQEWKAPFRSMSMVQWKDLSTQSAIPEIFGIRIRFGRFESGATTFR